MFSSIGLSEILLILFITLVVIGPEKLPDMARKLGRGLREVRRASNMFRDMLMLEDPADYNRPRLADERTNVAEIDDDSAPMVSGTIARGDYVRPPVRPVLLTMARRATHTAEIDLAQVATTDACTFEELTAPRG